MSTLFCYTGVIHVPFSISARTVLGVWFVGSLILGALYGGSLTSKLSLHKSPKPADSLKELLKRHPNAMLALRNNSQVHTFFSVSIYYKFIFVITFFNRDSYRKFHGLLDRIGPKIQKLFFKS